MPKPMLHVRKRTKVNYLSIGIWTQIKGFDPQILHKNEMPRPTYWCRSWEPYNSFATKLV